MKQLIIILALSLAGLQPILSQEIPHLTEKDFKENIWNFDSLESFSYTGNIPLVIEFTADWCRPCRLMEPTFKKIQKDYKGRVKVYKIDNDRNKALADQFGIRYLPSMLFIRPQSDSFDKIVGYKTEQDLKKLIKRKLKIRP